MEHNVVAYSQYKRMEEKLDFLGISDDEQRKYILKPYVELPQKSNAIDTLINTQMSEQRVGDEAYSTIEEGLNAIVAGSKF